MDRLKAVLGAVKEFGFRRTFVCLAWAAGEEVFMRMAEGTENIGGRCQRAAALCYRKAREQG